MIIQSQPIIYSPDLAARLLFTVFFVGGMVLILGQIRAHWGFPRARPPMCLLLWAEMD
jgi:hypothetical protein